MCIRDRCTQEAVAITHRLPIRICRTEARVMLASDPVVFAGKATSILVLPDDMPVSLGRPDAVADALLELERTGERVGVPELEQRFEGGPGSSMRTEIAEQPAVLERLVSTEVVVKDAVSLTARTRRVVFTGCGSAYHAALFAVDRAVYGARAFDAVAIPASEMEERGHTISSNDVVIALSQSGETADVIDAMVAASERGATTIGVVNVSGSSVARMVDIDIPLLAGTERSVLATKSFAAMLGRMVQLVGGVVGPRRDRTARDPTCELLTRATELDAMLSSADVAAWVEEVRTALEERQSALVVGAGAHMALASEAALKIKEGTYIHAEAVRAGELKHGVIALVDNGFPCLLMSGDATQASRQQIIAAELRSRGATVFELAEQGNDTLVKSTSGQSLLATPLFGQTTIAQL